MLPKQTCINIFYQYSHHESSDIDQQQQTPKKIKQQRD